jgi:hypothetical protein
MYQGQIRVIVAIIVLGGHFLVFFFGLLLGVFRSPDRRRRCPDSPDG